MFGPLTTIGADVPVWLAEFVPSFDCVAVWDVAAPSDGRGIRSLARALPTPPTSPSTRLATSTISSRFTLYVSFEFGLLPITCADPWAQVNPN
jgi:hypothetical protein